MKDTEKIISDLMKTIEKLVISPGESLDLSYNSCGKNDTVAICKKWDRKRAEVLNNIRETIAIAAGEENNK